MLKDMSFNDYRFFDLNYQDYSSSYFTMDRINDTSDKIVVKVDSSHLKETKFGYALILDCKHVVFLKKWQVSKNYYGNEILIIEKYWVVKEWGEWCDFAETEGDELNYSHWLNVAQEQQDHGNIVKWKKYD